MAVDEAATKPHGGGASPYRGGSKDKRLRALRRTATPTDNRILAKHNYECLTLASGAIIQGRGNEEPKGTEHARRNLQRSDRGDFVAVRAPQGRLRGARRAF